MKTTDKIDEILRLHILEDAMDANEDTANLEMNFILGLDVALEMEKEDEEKLLMVLQNAFFSDSFGKLLSSEMEVRHETPETIASKTMLPLVVINQLIEDHIHTTNVPVVMMKDLLKMLSISFERAEQAIRKTFLQLKHDLEHLTGTGSTLVAAPAFRKGGILSKATVDGLPKGSGKDLFENEEVLEKYLKRLKELSA